MPNGPHRSSVAHRRQQRHCSKIWDRSEFKTNSSAHIFIHFPSVESPLTSHVIPRFRQLCPCELEWTSSFSRSTRCPWRWSQNIFNKAFPAAKLCAIEQIMTEMLMCSTLLWNVPPKATCRSVANQSKSLLDCEYPFAWWMWHFDILCKLKVVEIKRHAKSTPSTDLVTVSNHHFGPAFTASLDCCSFTKSGISFGLKHPKNERFHVLHMALPRPEQCSLLKIILITPLISWRNMCSWNSKFERLTLQQSRLK